MYSSLLPSGNSTGSLEYSKRPWGEYQVLYEGVDCKLKQITVLPGQRLSLQYHTRRREHWQILQGIATVTLSEHSFIVTQGQGVNIGMGQPHRVANYGEENLIFLELQTGEYFGEDDIVRIKDDYNRN